MKKQITSIKNIIYLTLVILTAISASANPEIGVCRFMDDNGDCFTGPTDILAIRNCMLGVVNNYTGGYSCSDLYDTDGDSWASPTDLLTIRRIVLGTIMPQLNGCPKDITIESIPINMTVGEEAEIIFSVNAMTGNKRAGIGVEFESTDSELYGKDHSSGIEIWSNHIYSTTRSITNSDGKASFKVRALELGDISITPSIKGGKTCLDKILGDLTISVTCSPSEEICDGTDNDCNGVIDENLTQSANHTGICSLNTQTCSAGLWIDNNETIPAIEICDNLDNDCNGIIDNNLTQSTNQTGICGINTQICSIGAWINNNEINATSEICGNGIDENCDGIDAGCPAPYVEEEQPRRRGGGGGGGSGGGGSVYKPNGTPQTLIATANEPDAIPTMLTEPSPSMLIAVEPTGAEAITGAVIGDNEGKSIWWYIIGIGMLVIIIVCIGWYAFKD